MRSCDSRLIPSLFRLAHVQNHVCVRAGVNEIRVRTERGAATEVLARQIRRFPPPGKGDTPMGHHFRVLAESDVAIATFDAK
jgi:hypothetical protein